MGKGIHVVFRHNGRGGLLIVDGDTWIMDLLATALQDGDSRNPFQSVGLGEGVIFENPDQELWNDLRIQITDIFDRFEESKLARLQDRPDNLQVIQMGEGKYGMKVFFINLERMAPAEGILGGNANGFFITS